ncbi:MAG: hypothetical protein DIU70_004540 [Bacillota bacterium]|nr:MAG: hypothetical protein DIU70_05960 [Bacillota bacterium]
MWNDTDETGTYFKDYLDVNPDDISDNAREYNLQGMNESNGSGDKLYWGISANGTVFVTNVAPTSWADGIQVFTRRGIVDLDDIDNDIDGD